MATNLIATEGRLVVKLRPQEEVTSGGVFLSQPTNPDLKEGEVISVGPYLKDINQTFSEGDVVCWQNYSGSEFEEDGDKYIIINQRDILAIRK